jgi:IS30 family transposase
VSARTYTIQDRRRAVEMYAAGHSTQTVADTLGASRHTIGQWLRPLGILRSRGHGQRVFHRGGIDGARSYAERVAALYAAGQSSATIATLTGAHVKNVQYEVRRQGLSARYAGRMRTAHNSATTPKGRARLEQIRQIVRMKVVDQREQRDIAAALGIGQASVSRALQTPYAAALKAFVFGNANASRPQHARAMAEQGIDEGTICKVLGMELEKVRVWIETGRSY